GLSFDAPNPSSIEKNNALALAILPTGKYLLITNLTGRQMDLLVGSQAKDNELTGWELALVSTPSTDISSFQERQPMKNALEWLRSERVEYQRLADVLILKVNVCFLGDCLLEAFISSVVPRPEPVDHGNPNQERIGLYRFGEAVIFDCISNSIQK
ncbi:hypothetical protein Tco_1072956, partial [Tanacetum coccineum]